MSKATKCDVCGRTTPDVNCKFVKRGIRWYEFSWDSQGGSFQPLDVCEDCWWGYVSYMNNRFAMKSSTEEQQRGGLAIGKGLIAEG